MKKLKVYGSFGETRIIVATTSKKKAIEKIKNETGSSRKWIAGRIGETGNKDEIKLALLNPEKTIRVK